MDLALVSCVSLPEPDPDARPLAAALEVAGIRARVLGWDDPGADWSQAELTVLRSCWNYPVHREAFLSWAGKTATASRLWNPLEVVRWNTHKRYLLELSERGLPVVPTLMLERGSRTTLGEILDRQAWDEAVIKPAVSAASYRTRRATRATLDAGEAHLRELLVRHDVLVQRYLDSVEGYGERALIWIDGELTHAVRKSPRFEGDDESVSPESVPIPGDEADLAARAMAAVDAPLLYGRVDLARGPDGRPVIMELELVEPSLFFPQSPRALDRFVAAVAARL